MATGETVQTTEAVTTKPSYLLPKFTCERWREGLYDAEHKLIGPSMNIREDDLLTFNQRVEVETRSLIFQYQLKYAEKEYELMKKEFQSIEARLNQLESSDAEPAEHDFVKPVVPDKKPTKKAVSPEKKRTKIKSASGTDEKDSSADEPVFSDGKSNKRSGKQPKKNLTDKESSSETDEKRASADELVVLDVKSTKRSGKQIKKDPIKTKSGSEADKEFTSSQEGTDELRRSERKKK